jgi:hypothetical protein
MQGDLIMQDKPEKSDINWDIELNFDLPPPPKPKSEAPPEPPRIPPREVLKQKFPRILEKIELLWGTLELHRYFQQTQFMDREKRQGFPPDVIDALGQINNEHQDLLMRTGLLRMDVFDMQFREVANKKLK